MSNMSQEKIIPMGINYIHTNKEHPIVEFLTPEKTKKEIEQGNEAELQKKN